MLSQHLCFPCHFLVAAPSLTRSSYSRFAVMFFLAKHAERVSAVARSRLVVAAAAVPGAGSASATPTTAAASRATSVASTVFFSSLAAVSVGRTGVQCFPGQQGGGWCPYRKKSTVPSEPAQQAHSGAESGGDPKPESLEAQIEQLIHGSPMLYVYSV